MQEVPVGRCKNFWRLGAYLVEEVRQEPLVIAMILVSPTECRESVAWHMRLRARSCLCIESSASGPKLIRLRV